MAADTALRRVATPARTEHPRPFSWRAGVPDTGPAERRLARMFARFVSVGYVLYLVVLSPQIVEQSAWMPAWWTPTMVGVVWVPAVALGAVTFGADRWTARWAGCSALCFLITPVSWLLIDPGAVAVGAPTGAVPWVALIAGLPALAATLVWSTRYVVVYLVAVCALCQLVAHSSRGWNGSTILVLDTLFSIGFCSVFVGGAVMAIRTGRQLDRATVTARRHAAAAAEAQAREVERERFDALVHDGVLSTLLAATNGVDAALQRQAARTLAQIDGLRHADRQQNPLRTVEAVALLRAAATDADESITFRVLDSSSNNDVPAHVVRVVAAALGEAVRNSVRHASSPLLRARRWVVVEISDGALRVVVNDDGVGFDVKRVAHHRMGIKVSILGRMSQLDGGAAEVLSTPAEGTVVSLRWVAPE